MPRILLVFVLFCLLGTAQADETSATRQQIETARQDIAELQKLLKQIDQEKSGAQNKLKATESQIGQLEEQIDKLQQEIKNSQTELQQLDEKKTMLEGARLEQQKLVALQARLTYQNGREEYLKLVLNQQSPEKLSRTLTYYDYLSKARFEQIAALDKTLHELASVGEKIDTQQKQLRTQQVDLDERHIKLVEVRKERRDALAKLEKEESTREQKLKTRREEQAQLEKVLKTIEETLARQAREAEQARQRALAEARLREQRAREEEEARRKALANAAPKEAEKAVVSPPTTRSPIVAQPSQLVSSAGSGFEGAFQQARGRLPWPVNGRLLAHYGTPRGTDERSTWDGVMIGAAAGTTVRAVHGGRVVFADWLRGAGLLVILDHGNGYLSLYGHNQSLLRNAGEIVKAGEPIATVGNSGGQESAALYFAIRQNGRPSDPAQWCRAQG
ncbi:murein hydrolase activator EnvC family protein [Azomonas macrocytogenes]|uniref:Septal ring factor EnvC (AmiA/AmiB activator) n=1 Tax=Azomonas macrocytogenes TaxID=69962 RepID=A0A839T773_AZOMA|nr:peptidoglycan DD-metalloendopeptidase family protein [Azomonas macrocytogenes]MBB3104306.1 septal ring factor EnvC (AmiA/AmiB activator) [Azomonas macrocytogenes]